MFANLQPAGFEPLSVQHKIAAGIQSGTAELAVIEEELDLGKWLTS